MVEGEDWLMRPVNMGRCSYESLIDGTLDLGDIYRLNEAIDVETENTWRAQKAAESKAKPKTRR